jgi:F420-0:gamma-glutamyl ligase
VVATHINVAPFDFVLGSMDKAITLVKVMVEEEIPDASSGALIVLDTRGRGPVMEGQKGIVLGYQGISARAQHTVGQRNAYGLIAHFGWRK